MGYFNFLIDIGNGAPKPDMEYIYLSQEIWTPNNLYSSRLIKYGTIMTNVIQLDNGSYEFTCKETGEVFRTNYAWTLAENTPENVKKIIKYDRVYKKFKEYKKLTDGLRNEIVTLKTGI